MRKSAFDNYFQFTRSERTAWYLLIGCNVLLLLLYYWLQFYTRAFPVSKPKTILLTTNTTDHNQAVVSGHPRITDDTKEAFITAKKYFHFDPNILTIEQWQQLGVAKKTAITIRKYIEKGGRFRKPEDLEKIWGLTAKQKEELKPYVNINHSSEDMAQHKTPTNRRQVLLELNQADSQSLEKLPRIGPAMARRIISYRDRLGGFRQVEQLREVWGISDTAFEAIQFYVKADPRLIRLIDINQVQKETLRLHPYFGYKTASALIEYRNQHGNFNSLEEIQQIISIDEKTYSKIIQYLTLKK